VRDSGLLGAAANETGQAECNEEEPSGRLLEAMATADVDGREEGGSVVDDLPDSDAVGICDGAHCCCY